MAYIDWDQVRPGKGVTVERLSRYAGHRDAIFALYGHGTKFWTSGTDRLLVQWDTQMPDEGLVIARLQDSCYALAMDEERQALIAGQNMDGLQWLSLAGTGVVQTIHLAKTSFYQVLLHENLLYVAAGNGQLYVINPSGPAILKAVQISPQALRCLLVLQGQLWIGSSDGKVSVLDLATHQIAASWRAHEGACFDMGYDSFSDTVISAGKDATLKRWDAIAYTGVALQAVPAHLFAIHALTINPEHPLMLTGSMDKTLKLWHTETLTLLKVVDKARYEGHSSSVNRILWSNPAEMQAISVSDDKEVALWQFGFGKIG